MTRIFYDAGPTKRYQWGPTKLAHIIFGYLGGDFVENMGSKAQSGFKTLIFAKNGIF